MSNLNKNVSLEEAKDILEFHEKIFGIKENLEKTKYLSISAKIFHTINLFSIIDNKFSDPFLKSLVHDIVVLLKYFEISENKKDSNIKEIKNQAILVINTKLYFLDLLVWEKVDKSVDIKTFLRLKEILHVKNSFDFFSSLEGEFNFVLEPRYSSSIDNLKPEYKSGDLDFLISLDGFRERRTNSSLRALIKSKNQISFFENMQVEDVKNTVKDVVFAKYKMHEKIIRENDETYDIFFLMSGKCRVTIANENVGMIEKDQIFGEFSAITKQKRAATVIAHEPVTVLSFKFKNDLFKSDPYSFTILHKNIIEQLIQKIDSLNNNKF